MKQEYSPLITELLSIGGSMPLDAGKPDAAGQARLNGLTLEALFAPRAIRDRDMARACLAGLWLYHNDLDRSHTLSQDIETPTGSFWHGIMHRREGDFSNAKYWFHRVGAHPIFPALAKAAGEASWDPFAFVDLCQRACEKDKASESRCRDIQASEWNLLFDHCFRLAV